MPNISTGIDLVEISRIEDAVKRFGDRFLTRIFTTSELELVGSSIPSLAARFAAKEAVSKALGTGIGLVSWQDIEILRDDLHPPLLVLHGKADEVARKLGLTKWSVSLSHTREHATAVAVALTE